MTLPSNLPTLDLSSRPTTSVSHSPPPGRPGNANNRDKRGRESSGSESGMTDSKVARQSECRNGGTEVRTADQKKKSVGKADLVSEEAISPSGEKDLRIIPDLGKFTSVEGTTSKMYPSLDFVQSPIISKSGRRHQE